MFAYARSSLCNGSCSSAARLRAQSREGDYEWQEGVVADVATQRLWLQNRMLEVYQEKVQKHTMSSDEWEERQELQLVDRANALDVKPEPKSKLA